MDTVVPERTRMRTRLAGPSRLPAHASSAGSTFARTCVASVGQPVPAGASASTSRRCVTAVPERGVRTTCTSGAWASPRESASTVAPARCALPCTAWWTLSAMSRSASASTASSSARSSASTAWPSGVARTGRPALPNGIVVSSHTFAASPARQRRRSPRPSATLLARSASGHGRLVRAQVVHVRLGGRHGGVGGVHRILLVGDLLLERGDLCGGGLLLRAQLARFVVAATSAAFAAATCG